MATGVVKKVQSAGSNWQIGRVKDNADNQQYLFIQDLRVKKAVSKNQLVTYSYLDFSGVDPDPALLPNKKVAVDLD